MRVPLCNSRLHVSILAAGLLVIMGLAVGAPARADDVVRGFYFYSPDCDHCEAVAREVLPGIQERFGASLELRMFDITVPQNLKTLEAMEARYGLKEVGLPEAFIGPDALVGEEAMRSGLAELIEKHLAAGGADFPTQDTPAPTPTPGPTAASTATPAAAPLLHVAYFYTPGCGECERVAYDLTALAGVYPGLRVTRFDRGARDAALLYEALAARAGLSQEKRLGTPAVFVGDQALVGAELTRSSLEALLQRYQAKGAPAVWESIQGGDGDGAKEQALASIVERFRSFGPPAVIGFGLVDGLNPCAFATVVFFISYLAFIGRSRKEMLLVGGAFTVGVFVTYFLAGLSALQFLRALAGRELLRRAINGLMAALCLLFAGASIYDAWQAWRGKPEAMQLRLPRFLQQRVHRVIRENTSRSAFVGVAGLTGLVVSFLELACTGQVYLPTLIAVQSEPTMRPLALSYLGLYNVAFIAPLVAVFLVAAFGVSSQQMAGLVQKHTGSVKLATAAVFALLGIYLLSTVLQA